MGARRCHRAVAKRFHLTPYSVGEGTIRILDRPPKVPFAVLQNIIDFAWLGDQGDVDGLFHPPGSPGRSMAE
jgi:hypothetical protein